jgi:TRAP-type C4-dicarboxylate transport system permease small subunit
MNGYLMVVEKLSKFMSVIAGCALTFIMLLTVADVVLRLFGHPIVGTFELVSFGGAVAIGFAIPITSWVRGHIYVDFFLTKFSPGLRRAFNLATRLGSIAIFVLIGWQLLVLAGDFYTSGEVSLTRHIPFYPITYGMGICAFIQCLVLIGDIIKIFGGDYE